MKLRMWFLLCTATVCFVPPLAWGVVCALTNTDIQRAISDSQNRQLQARPASDPKLRSVRAVQDPVAYSQAAAKPDFFNPRGSADQASQQLQDLGFPADFSATVAASKATAGGHNSGGPIMAFDLNSASAPPVHVEARFLGADRSSLYLEKDGQQLVVPRDGLRIDNATYFPGQGPDVGFRTTPFTSLPENTRVRVSIPGKADFEPYERELLATRARSSSSSPDTIGVERYNQLVEKHPDAVFEIAQRRVSITSPATSRSAIDEAVHSGAAVNIEYKPGVRENAVAGRLPDTVPQSGRFAGYDRDGVNLLVDGHIRSIPWNQLNTLHVEEGWVPMMNIVH
jgi:hypothetical protein